MLGAQDDDRASLGSSLANGGGGERRPSQDRYKSDPFYLGVKGDGGGVGAGGAARGGGGGADVDDLRDSYYDGGGTSTALALTGDGGQSFDDEYAGGARAGGKGRKGKKDKGKRGRGGKGEAYAVDKVEVRAQTTALGSFRSDGCVVYRACGPLEDRSCVFFFMFWTNCEVVF